ncbi:hypothetical protein QE152_g40251 [Popillia japonica]|uniref:Reverse transcriptase domain-containing protein n=1 Tax=Popillia japonica TaxID=7064 RepID=A0AAW1HRP6_POPJA
MVIYERVLAFLDQHSVVKSNNHGFRRRRSTETAAVDFVEYLSKNLDQKKCVVGLFFDFSAAFDSVDSRYHTSWSVEILLNKEDIPLLQWPSNPADLNPIENLWHGVEELKASIMACTDSLFRSLGSVRKA